MNFYYAQRVCPTSKKKKTEPADVSKKRDKKSGKSSKKKKADRKRGKRADNTSQESDSGSGSDDAQVEDIVGPLRGVFQTFECVQGASVAFQAFIFLFSCT
jgi:hypothetical protein